MLGAAWTVALAGLLGFAPPEPAPAPAPLPIETLPIEGPIEGPGTVEPGGAAEPAVPASAVSPAVAVPPTAPVVQSAPVAPPSAPHVPLSRLIGPPTPEPAPGSRLTLDHQPGPGVRIQSVDGRYALQIWLRGQLRETVSHDPNASPELTNSIEFRRASVFFAGNVFGPHNKYFMQLVFDPRGLGMQGGQVTQSPLFDFFLTFDYWRDLSVRVGQYKPFFSRQFIAAWGDLQFVDRSIIQQEFLMERDLGFDLFSNDLGGLDLFRYSLGLYAGQGRNNLAVREFRMSYVARLEVLPLGGFDEYVEGDLERRRKPKLALGLAYAFSDHAQGALGVNGPIPADGGTTNMHHLVADGVFKVRGFSATGEFFWRRGTRNPGSAVDDMGVVIPVSAPRNGVGWFVQGGYLLPNAPVEFVGRGGQTIAMGNSGLGSVGELGVGPNWYLRDHAMKLQLDYFHTWSNADFAGGGNEVRLQLQFGI